ncbi:MAG TPA: acyl-ACP--UDP-N-acetylglucosamine O-acyltransferase [Pirellulales bacterium]|nr:acyl-ACP--UDP-N-acetylglucosamine O-acyltransferase [Pirellulales bacterium]
MNIHPTALVSAHAKLGHDVVIGPFCLVEDGTEIGEGCKLEARVSIRAGTTLGPRNWVCEGTVLGGLPQHTRVPEHPGTVVIGSGNTIRENVTVHRALHENTVTRIGDNNLLMVGAHVAHDCQVGNNIIFANNCLLAGHVTIDDRAYISGAVAIHQFCRVGRFAMVGGQARIVQDVPPFVTIDGQSGNVVGLNMVGLRRNGFDTDAINQLKAAYRIIYRQGHSWSEVLAHLQQFADGPVVALYHFLCGGTRGFVQERRLPPNATLKLRKPADEAADAPSRKAMFG